MIRHAPSLMAALTLLCGACTWLARTTGAPRAVLIFWAVVTTTAFAVFVMAALITPGGSDE